MHLRILLSLAATALHASAKPQLLASVLPAGPRATAPIDSAVAPVIASAVAVAATVATAPISSAVAPIVASAVAAAESVAKNATADSISGLDISPDQLFDNILTAIAILDVILTLLGSSELADDQNAKIDNLNLSASGLAGLANPGSSGSLGSTITSLTALVCPLLSTSAV